VYPVQRSDTASILAAFEWLEGLFLCSRYLQATRSTLTRNILKLADSCVLKIDVAQDKTAFGAVLK